MPQRSSDDRNHHCRRSTASALEIGIEIVFGAKPKAPRQRRYCMDKVLFVGPHRGRIRGWRADDTPAPSADTSVAQVEDNRLPQPWLASHQPAGSPQDNAAFRRALRRQRQLGLVGHPAYSLERHLQLRASLSAATDLHREWIRRGRSARLH